jgi:site-specific recombinase XerD
MIDPSHIRITGPLKSYVGDVWSALLARGYTPLSSGNLLRLMARLSGWLEGKGLQAQELTHACIAEFLEERRQTGYTEYLSRRGLEPILKHLQTAGIISLSEHTELPSSELDRLLNDYGQYLLHERAVIPTTVRRYQRVARSLLEYCFKCGSLELSRLSAADVASFVTRQSRTSSVGFAKETVTALRCALRFLYLRGELATDLAGAVPAVANWRQASLPKALPHKEVKQLLGSCDRRTHGGRRDFAVLVLLVRLGLRAGEVADLELDDIDWTRGEVVIQGKGREDRLPLPNDVGEAVVAYLRRGRPQLTSCRKLFISSRAPLGGISASAVIQVVRRACRRAGLAPSGSHRLRHTAATQMLRQGASLPEIAQVLRHHHLDTTAIYAKVDRRALRKLTQPWPGGAS